MYLYTTLTLAECSLHDKVFIIPYLEWEVVPMGILLYHVCKRELVPSYNSICIIDYGHISMNGVRTLQL